MKEVIKRKKCLYIHTNQCAKTRKKNWGWNLCRKRKEKTHTYTRSSGIKISSREINPVCVGLRPCIVRNLIPLASKKIFNRLAMTLVPHSNKNQLRYTELLQLQDWIHFFFLYFRDMGEIIIYHTKGIKTTLNAHGVVNVRVLQL